MYKSRHWTHQFKQLFIIFIEYSITELPAPYSMEAWFLMILIGVCNKKGFLPVFIFI